jgi:hypothetical protein
MNMKYQLKLLISLVCCLNGMAQPYHMQLQNAYNTSGAYSTHFMDAFSFSDNPACLATEKNMSFGLLSERKWMLEELDNYEMAASCAAGNGGLGMAVQYSGDMDFNEQVLQLAYGKNLGRIQLGIQFAYQEDRTAAYPTVGFGSARIGTCFHVSEKLITGWVIGLSAGGATGGTNPERDAGFFEMGFGYEMRPDLFLAMQITKTSGQPVNITGSLEYRYGEQFFFSIGLKSDLSTPYFKSGWKKNQLCIQLYTEYQTALGFSPGLVFLLEGKNKKK